MLTEPSSERMEQGLRNYVARVAAGFGVGLEASWYEVVDFASAYLALPERMSGWPDHDAALVWDQQHGWAMAREPGPGQELRVLAYHGEPLLPAPRVVVAFARRILAHGASSQPVAPVLGSDQLATWLAAYAATEPLPDRTQEPTAQQPEGRGLAGQGIITVGG